jgi:hypothetical protein
MDDDLDFIFVWNIVFNMIYPTDILLLSLIKMEWN